MIVNTQRLFANLLSRMRIDIVCDVGSMNAADALTFRAAAPESTVYAFEPNPDNLRVMNANRTLAQRDIQVVPLAATNYDGEAEFFLVAADYSRKDPRRGMSSLYRRADEWAPAAVVRVGTTRLDTFLAGKSPANGRLALWIDVEGKAHEVIEGITGVAEQTYLLHVEVETAQCIGSNQKLYGEVRPLLERLGFMELARDQAPTHVQFNTVFVRRNLPAVLWLRVQACFVSARLRYLVGTAALRLRAAVLGLRAPRRR